MAACRVPSVVPVGVWGTRAAMPCPFRRREENVRLASGTVAEICLMSSDGTEELNYLL